ncbi:MAG: hypothetical protein Q3962_04035 [Corynebacterium sp.]|nr:hypothetical protein [Corynebacterium sp.]
MNSKAPMKASRILLAGLLIPAALGLAACGGGGSATSSASLTSSVAPLTRGASPSGTSAAATTSLTDEVGHEISSIPSQTPDISGAQESFIQALRQAGFKTDGYEKSLISTAQNYCSQPQNPWVTAIIGQLVTQGLVSLGQDQAVSAFTDAITKGGICAGITPVSTSALPAPSSTIPAPQSAESTLPAK